MICGMEIGLAIFGLLALVRGKMTISKTKVVVGVPARLIGLLALTPLPVALGVVLLFTLAKGGVNDPEQFARDQQLTITLIEAGTVIGIAILVFVLGAVFAVHPKEAERRERAGRYDDEYEDEYEDARDRDDRRDGDRRDRPRDDRDDDYDDRDDRKPKPWQR